MHRICVLLTFDHELPLGGVSRGYDEALFTPTRSVMDVAEKHNVPVNLFTDVLGAMRFQERGHQDFFVKNEIQLQDALKRGHDVQLHLHPHWLETDIQDNRFIPGQRISLADFRDSDAPNDIGGIVHKGMEFLRNICKKVLPNYRCVAYRAGGFNLSPESETILQALYEEGIRFDSSICPGFTFHSSISHIDYKRVPQLPNWYLGRNGNLHVAADNGLYEVPIAGKRAGLMINARSFVRRYLHRSRLYFTGPSMHSGRMGFWEKVKYKFSKRMLSFDDYTAAPRDNARILDHWVKQYRDSESIVFSTISHPKAMGEYALTLMEKFIQYATNRYGDDLGFYTYRQLYDDFFSTGKIEP